MWDEDSVVQIDGSSPDHLWEIARVGAKRMLQEALEAEIEEFIEGHREKRLDSGRRRVTRNGHHRERPIQTGLGGVEVRVPRARDRGASGDEAIKFTSSLVPPYLRRTRNIEELLPVLYLCGVSSGNFKVALEAILGPGAPGLSSNTICRLKATWEEEHDQWRHRRLEGRTYAYLWADGIYCRVRGEDQKQCLLVLVGAREDGRKELVAIESGYREDELSWKRVLLDLQGRGLTTSPRLAIGDGALGFWKALDQVYPETEHQRCWRHKTVNVLSRLPKSRHSDAKNDLREIWQAATRKEADAAFDRFLHVWEPKYPKAAACLDKDRDSLLTFFTFPARHWRSIRTTNPIESTFATVRHRTKRSKGCLTRSTMLAMVFKLAQSAQRRWRRLHGYGQIADVVRGVIFKDGIKLEGVA